MPPSVTLNTLPLCAVAINLLPEIVERDNIVPVVERLPRAEILPFAVTSVPADMLALVEIAPVATMEPAPKEDAPFVVILAPLIFPEDVMELPDSTFAFKVLLQTVAPVIARPPDIVVVPV